jgi:UDP-glucose 4-epimerase
VIPLFLDQIANGGPVTITEPSMTRFLLSLDQAADTVFTALRDAHAGETYVPRAPSATVENIARALIGGKSIQTKAIGIRPGEKMHEIMVSEEEAHHCVSRGEYFAILPMLPELRRDAPAEPNALSGEFSSADTVLDAKATAELLRRHGLVS